MTVHLDYTQLDQPQIILSLVRANNGYIVWDQNCRFYILAPSSLEFCLRFLQAGADKGDWLIDDSSIERATWHSVRVPDGMPALAKWHRFAETGRVSELSEAGGRTPRGGLRETAEPVPPVSESPSNVVPIRKGA